MHEGEDIREVFLSYKDAELYCENLPKWGRGASHWFEILEKEVYETSERESKRTQSPEVGT